MKVRLLEQVRAAARRHAFAAYEDIRHLPYSLAVLGFALAQRHHFP